jgi:poly(3-hydroxybutyrate) depolymerase
LPDESGQVQGRAEPRGRPGPRGRGPRERFPLRQGDEEKSFEFQGRRRTYIVHMPPGHDRSSAMPLVIVLHGGVVNAFFTAYNTGMNSTADREGFIAVYPNGTGRLEDRILTWNVGFGFGYALRNNVDDVGFLRELIERMVSEYGADPGRVYATGISNGGIMSYRLASEASDLVAAVAPVAVASAGRHRCHQVASRRIPCARAPGVGHRVPRDAGPFHPLRRRQGSRAHQRRLSARPGQHQPVGRLRRMRAHARCLDQPERQHHQALVRGWQGRLRGRPLHYQGWRPLVAWRRLARRWRARHEPGFYRPRQPPSTPLCEPHRRDDARDISERPHVGVFPATPEKLSLPSRSLLF